MEQKNYSEKFINFVVEDREQDTLVLLVCCLLLSQFSIDIKFVTETSKLKSVSNIL